MVDFLPRAYHTSDTVIFQVPIRDFVSNQQFFKRFYYKIVNLDEMYYPISCTMCPFGAVFLRKLKFSTFTLAFPVFALLPFRTEHSPLFAFFIPFPAIDNPLQRAYHSLDGTYPIRDTYLNK